jgi:iron complex outermembrane receptor protein
MQRSPDFTASLGANYRFEMLGGDTTLSGNFYYTSKFYFDPTQQSSQDAYGLLGLHAEWVDPSRRYTVAVYGDNVTGQRYRTQVLPNTTGFASVWAAPATWGVSLGAKF